jgi:hypothetical protein
MRGLLSIQSWAVLVTSAYLPVVCRMTASVSSRMIMYCLAVHAPLASRALSHLCMQVVTGEQLPTGAVEPGMQDQAA